MVETNDFTLRLHGVNDYGRHFIEGTAFKLKIENKKHCINSHLTSVLTDLDYSHQTHPNEQLSDDHIGHGAGQV